MTGNTRFFYKCNLRHFLWFIYISTQELTKREENLLQRNQCGYYGPLLHMNAWIVP